MHATNECDSLLIESETVQHDFAQGDVAEMIPDTKLTRSLILKRQPLQRRKAVSFSCENFFSLEYLLLANSI